MQKINRTTNDRAQDEDWRRVYAELTSLRADLNSMKPAPVTPTPNISPTPPIIPPSAGVTVNPVEPANNVGILPSYSASDHAHEGVHSVKVFGDIALTGDVVFEQGTGFLLGQSGNNIIFNAVFGTIPPKIVVAGASPYTVLGGDFVIFADTTAGPVTIQFTGGAPNTGRLVVIVNQGTVTPVTVTNLSGGVIGITSIVNTTGKTAVWYISDGSNWYSITNSTGN